MSTPKEIKCAQCRKVIKSVIHECRTCIKTFHPSCAKLHKVFNEKNQLIICRGQIEIIAIPTSSTEEEQIRKCKRGGDEMEEEGDVETLTNDKLGDIQNNIMEVKNKTSSDNEIKKSVEKVMREEFKQLKQQLLVENIGQEFREAVKEIITEQVNKLTKKLTDEIMYLRTKLEELVKDKSSHVIKGKERQNDESGVSRSDKIKEAYAQVVRKSKKNEIIVQPVREQESESTAGTMKNNVNIMQLGVSVERIIKGSKGRITLECEKTKDKEILKEALTKKLGTQYKVYSPSKKLPKVKVVGIEERIGKEDEAVFIEKISIQNELNTEKDTFKMKIIKIITARNQEITMILEVDQYTHKYLVERQRMKVGWNNCRVYDYVSVVRCYKCWGYNHFAAECKGETTCKGCAGNHEYMECQNSTKKCVNCLKSAKKLNLNIACDHEATDIECESYKRIVNKIRRNIKYCEE